MVPVRRCNWNLKWEANMKRFFIFYFYDGESFQDRDTVYLSLSSKPQTRVMALQLSLLRFKLLPDDFGGILRN